MMRFIVDQKPDGQWFQLSLADEDDALVGWNFSRENMYEMLVVLLEALSQQAEAEEQKTLRAMLGLLSVLL
jgi:hypothetical protein